MCAKLGMAVQAMGGRDMFQALQSGALDAGEFIGPWTDSALGFYQIAKNYYWPGVGEPSSAEECGVNKAAYDDLPDDLKQAVSFACESLYNPVWTEYTTKHAQALKAAGRRAWCPGAKCCRKTSSRPWAMPPVK